MYVCSHMVHGRIYIVGSSPKPVKSNEIITLFLRSMLKRYFLESDDDAVDQPKK